MRRLLVKGAWAQTAGSGGEAGSSALRNWITRAWASAAPGTSSASAAASAVTVRFMVVLSSVGSKAHELRAVVDVGADGGEQDQVAPAQLDDARLEILREQDQHAGGGGVAVPLDVAGNALFRQRLALHEAVHQPLVGLVEVPALHFRREAAVLPEHPVDALLHEHGVGPRDLQSVDDERVIRGLRAALEVEPEVAGALAQHQLGVPGARERAQDPGLVLAPLAFAAE